ncbi:hypothetical protein L1887_16126 [Cichorium endivia]|nr:hypothetical protein L1887_16126 [Cichorium endivia]
MNPVYRIYRIVPESYEYREKVYVDDKPRRSSRSYSDLRRKFESLRGNGENLLRIIDDFGVEVQYCSSVNNRSRRGEGGKEGVYPSEMISGDICHHPSSQLKQEARTCRHIQTAFTDKDKQSESLGRFFPRAAHTCC